MNKAILAGRLAKDPEIRYTQSGKAVASFPLAVNRPWVKDNNQPGADFIPIIAWNKLAEIVGNNLVKGSQIVVDGRMQVRSYDAQDGSKRYVTEVVANEIEFMGTKHQQEPPAGGASSANQFGPSVPDEEIPF
jgi:single-strand DNA-binding protein